MAFSDILNGVTTSGIETLPFLHSCDAYHFREILKSQKLSPTLCDVFNLKYLYMYYGIPSYRKAGMKPTGLYAYYPVCFIININYVNTLTPKRLFPFDSGAFKKMTEIKEKYFYPKMEAEHFEIIPDIDNAKKLISKFYQSNANYIEKNVQVKNGDISSMNFEAQSYLSLISDNTETKFDNRVATIEFILDQELKLTEDSIFNIILPQVFLDDDEVSKWLIKLNIQTPITYSTIKTSPGDFFTVIYDRYCECLKNNGLM